MLRTLKKANRKFGSYCETLKAMKLRQTQHVHLPKKFNVTRIQYAFFHPLYRRLGDMKSLRQINMDNKPMYTTFKKCDNTSRPILSCERKFKKKTYDCELCETCVNSMHQVEGKFEAIQHTYQSFYDRPYELAELHPMLYRKISSKSPEEAKYDNDIEARYDQHGTVHKYYYKLSFTPIDTELVPKAPWREYE